MTRPISPGRQESWTKPRSRLVRVRSGLLRAVDEQPGVDQSASGADAVGDRRGLRAMRQALSAAAIRLAVLRRYLSPARPPQPISRDKP